MERLIIVTLMALTAMVGTISAYSPAVWNTAGTGPVVIESEIDSASTYVQSENPEFPTVALPVAAILGLAFIMQRRKEE